MFKATTETTAGRSVESDARVARVIHRPVTVPAVAFGSRRSVKVTSVMKLKAKLTDTTCFPFDPEKQPYSTNICHRSLFIKIDAITA